MRYYFKFATRELLKNPLISLGSLMSMVIGILCVFLIFLWVNDELTTDRFHSQVDNIYIPVIQNSPMDDANPITASLFFKIDYSEFSNIKSSLATSLYGSDRIKLKIGDEIFRGEGMITDSTFFDFFDFKLRSGNSETILKSPANIVLTESMANKMFGNEDPIGKTVFLECDKTGYYQVAGIMEDIPSNSSIKFDFLVPRHSQDWWGNSGLEFVLVDTGFDKVYFDEEIKHLGRSHSQFKESLLSTVAFNEVYFNHHFSGTYFSRHGNLEEVRTLIMIAAVILLISILNFTNMQSTLMLSQMKTKGIKRVNGATNFDFNIEMLVGRLIYTLMVIAIVFGIFQLIKPFYQDFLGISIPHSWSQNLTYIGLGAFAFSLLSSIFTLLQTSKVVTAKALIGQLNNSRISTTSKVLTTIQYVFAIGLIIVTSVVYKQFKHMQNKDLGFRYDNIVSVKFFDRLPYIMGDAAAAKKARDKQLNDYNLVKSELTNKASIMSYSQGPLPIDGAGFGMSWKLSGSDFEYKGVNIMVVDPGYADLLGLEIIRGRGFSDSLDMSRQHKIVINRAAMDYWGIENVEGAKLASSSWSGEDDPYIVIGVVEDFHYENLSKKIEPLIMLFFRDVESEFLVRIAPGQLQPSLASLEELYSKVNPKETFEYRLLEDKIMTQYNREKKLSEIFMIFTCAGLLISSIGLFTFALYETRKRIKEVGIRKVIGANITEIVSLLSLSFMKWVGLAFIIACPIAWYFMSEWLANFASQTSLSWWVFAMAGALTLIVALFTVVGQTYEAASRNPVDALRCE